MCGTTGERENVRRVTVRDVSNKDMDLSRQIIYGASLLKGAVIIMPRCGS